MKCLLKILNLNAPASDGSVVPYDVLQSYIDSEECKKALRDKTMVSSFTHRCRNIQAVFPDKPALSKTIGRDDLFGIVDEAAPTITHYITSLEIRSDGWLWGTAEFLEESGLDDISIQNLRRLKGLIKNGIKIGCSCIILGAWKSQGKGTDILAKLVQFKGVDMTFNASWKNAELVEAWEEDESGERIKTYSENTEDINEDTLKVKAFSDLSSFNYTGPKTSKINGQFTVLKAKQFSSVGVVEDVDTEEVVTEVEKEFSTQEENTTTEEVKEKEFTQAGIRDQLREKKMSPRMCFRRMILSYKQVVRAMGGVDKIKEDDLSILKSMLTSDVLFLLNRISDDVITKNKRINVILGCSSVSKLLRVAAENLNYIYRMSGISARKQGYLQKNYYTKLQAAWNEFVNACLEEVFGANSNNMPENIDEEMKEEK